MIDRSSPNQASAALRNAFPYLRLFQGRTFVIKAGGDAFLERAPMRALLEQVSILHRMGIHVVLVHGGGPQIDALSTRLGLDPVFADGRRVTCDATLQATSMALCGQVNTQIVACLGELETPAIGLSGVDGRLITATRRPPVKSLAGQSVDYGNVGDIERIDTAIIDKLFGDGFLPVVSPLCASASGELLNVNADSVASALAVALSAEKAIFMTSAPGILLDVDDPSSLLSYTDLRGLGELTENGTLQEGMLPKANAIACALEGGVPRVHVISHVAADSLLIEVFTNGGSGTMVVRDQARMTPEEQSATGTSVSGVAEHRER